MKYILILALVCLPLRAANAGTPEQADMAVRIFNTACVANMNLSTEAHADWAIKAHLERMDKSNEDKLLRHETGSAWKVSGPIGGFILVFSASQKCRLIAHEADTARLKQQMSGIMDGVKRPELVVEKVKDEDMKAGKGIYNQLTYLVHRPSENSSFVFIVGTNPDNDEFQGSLLVSLYTQP